MTRGTTLGLGVVVAASAFWAVACLDTTVPPEYRGFPSFNVLQVDSSYRLPSHVSQAPGLRVWPTSVAALERDVRGQFDLRGLASGFAVVSEDGNLPLAWLAVTGQERSDPVLVAHHGVPALAPENTLAGVRIACEHRLPGIEVDVRFTRDSVPVLIHDRDVRRTSNGTGNIDELGLSQLRLLDFGSWYSREFSSERIPTLSQFLALAQTCAFDVVMLDVKAFEPLRMDSAWAVLARETSRAGLASKLYVYYPDLWSLSRAKVLLPGVRTVFGAALVDSTLAAEIIRRHVDFIALTVDGYRDSEASLVRLRAAGVGSLVYGVSYPLEPDGLVPFPTMVISDWGWARPQ